MGFLSFVFCGLCDYETNFPWERGRITWKSKVQIFLEFFFIQLGKKSDEFPITAGHCHFLVNVTHIGMKCAFVWDYFQPVKIKMKTNDTNIQDFTVTFMQKT